FSQEVRRDCRRCRVGKNRKTTSSQFRSDLHLRQDLATSRVWAEVLVAFLPSLDLHLLSVRECWLCVHEPLHGAVPSLSYVLLWLFRALSCSKEVLPFQRAFPYRLIISHRRLKFREIDHLFLRQVVWREVVQSECPVERLCFQ